MPYTKHNYQKGDELLASQLNDMDDQIALNEQTADILVTVSNTQPLEEKNRVWVKATPSEIEIPTMEDHNELSRHLSDVENKVYALEPINIGSYPTVRIAVNMKNRWSNAGYSKFIPASVFPIKHISVKSNADRGSVICFLKTNNYAVDTPVVYATGTGRTFIQADQVMEFDIPDDCNYINILDHWPDDYLPQYIKMTKSKIDKIESQIMSDDKIGLTIDYWSDHTSILSTVYNTAGNAQGTTSYSATSVLKASGFVPLYGKMLELPLVWATDTTFPNYGMSLYDKDFQPIMGRAISAFPLRGENDPYIVWVHVYIPENAKYFRTTYWMEVSEDKPDFTYNLLKEIPDEYKPITHELPVDTYMQNAIRRARQLTDIKWTPRVKIPRYSMLNGGSDYFLDWFYPDKEYIGIPYSGAGKGERSASGWTAPEEWGYAHKWVGGCIPFESFITAARYPNSVFSETVDQQAPDYDSSPFGIVCTGLVNYTVNGPWPLRGITNFFNTSDNVFRTPSSNNRISDIDRNEIMIGDFLYTKPHVIVITDILRDAEGNVTHVEMSEATTVGNGNNTVLGTQFGGVARRKMWEYSEFKRLYGNYVKYRRTTFYGIPYVPSKYVDTGNEGNRENIQDLPCIPYLGNGAIYREGYIHNSKILIGATGFTSLVVTKDGEEFGTFDVTALTEVSVGFSAVGSYEAYLTNGTTRTMACNWTVASGTM